jgi:hypothetical protein
MAGFNININSGSNDPNNPTPIDPAQVKPESVQSLGKDKKLTASRIILEKRLRDAERQAEKIATRLQSQVLVLNAESQKALRGAKSVEEIEEILSSRFGKQINRISQLHRDLDSAIDNARTRVKVSRAGKKSDITELDALEEIIRGQLENAPGQIQKILDMSREISTENLESKEQEKSRKKNEIESNKQTRRERQQEERYLKRRARQVEELARSEEILARDQFLSQNQAALQTTAKEDLIGIINNTLLLGRRGSFKTTAEQRKAELLGLAESAGREAGDKVRRKYGIVDASELADQEARERLNLEDVPTPSGSGSGKRGGKLPGFFTQSGMDSLRNTLAPAASLASVIAVITTKLLGGLDKLSDGMEALNSESGAKFAGTFTKNLNSIIGAPIADKFGTFFEKNLSILEKIANTIEQRSAAFSPEILNASIDRQLAFLESDIERGQQLGAMTARIMRGQTDLSLATRRFQDKLLQLAGPALLRIIKILEDILNGLTVVITVTQSTIRNVSKNIAKGNWLQLASPSFWVNAISLGILQAMTKNKSLNSLLPEIDAFLMNQDPTDRAQPNPANRPFMKP